MKIAVSSTGKTLESPLDQRFGRCAYFLIVDTDTMIVTVVDNAAAASSSGAGISAAQSVVDNGARAVITGNVGPNAMNVLKAANIELYSGFGASVQWNVEQYKKGELARIDRSVPQHFGMGAV